MEPQTEPALAEPKAPARSLLGRVRGDLLDLYRAPAPNARFLITTGAFWTVCLAATDPYKSLFYQHLGYDNSGIGRLLALDMVVRSSGLALSGLCMRTFGAKRMLVGADIVSWVLPYLLLGLATQAWMVAAAVLCTSLNAFASTPYNVLMAEGMPVARRARAYAFLHLWNVAPTVVVPLLAGWLMRHGEFGTVARGMFLFQAGSMALGIFLRSRHLQDLPADPSREGTTLRETLGQLVRSRPYLAAWAALAAQWVFIQLWGNYLGIFLTQHLHQERALPAWISEASAAGFLVGSLGLVPRFSESRLRSAAPLGLLAQAVLVGLFALRPEAPLLLSLAALGGLVSSLYLGATSAILTHTLPDHLRDHGFSVTYIGAFLTSAALMPLAGKLLQDHLVLFPVLASLTLVAWMVPLGLSDRLLKRQGI